MQPSFWKILTYRQHLYSPWENPSLVSPPARGRGRGPLGAHDWAHAPQVVHKSALALARYAASSSRERRAPRGCSGGSFRPDSPLQARRRFFRYFSKEGAPVVSPENTQHRLEAGRLKGPTRGVKFLNGSETRSRLYAYTCNVQAYVGYCSRRADMITSVCNVRRPLGSSTWRQSFPIPTWHCPGNSKEAAHVGSTKMPR